MTCIVGVEKNGRVYLGADSCGSNGYSQFVTVEPKVFRNGEDDHAYLCTDFIDAVRACLKEGGFTQVKDNVEIGGFCLVGYRGRLYYLENDFHLRRVCFGVGAVGAGDMVALGALHAAPQNLTPRQRLERALSAASEFVVGVTPPFHFIESKRYTRAAA